MVVNKETSNQFIDIEGVVDAMAVWECISLEHMPGRRLPDGGMVSNREYVATTFTPFCLKWFDYLQRFFDWCESFDMEFVPIFVNSLPTYDVVNITSNDICLALSKVLNGNNNLFAAGDHAHGN